MHDTSKAEIMEYLSHNILYLRKKYNLSKEEMAKIMCVSIKTLNKLEQRILPPRLSLKPLFRIKEYFGIPLQIQVSIKIVDDI